MNNQIIFTIIALICSCICGFITIPSVMDYCKKNNLFDIPNARKIHNHAIPRLGGIVFLPCMLIGCIIVFAIAQLNGETTITLSLWTIYFTAGIIPIYFTGIIDDIIGLSPITKLTVQLLASCTLPIAGLYINNLHGFCGIYELSYPIGFILTIVVMAFISNAINLIDGIDGQASCVTIIALLGFIYAFARWELWYYVIMISSLIGVLIAYTYFNLFGNADKNRKIFMGDTGSLSIGFLLAFLCLKLSMHNTNLPIYNGNGLLTAYTLLIVPVFDAFRVAIVRIKNKRSPFIPDKNHIHHKIMRAGFNQHQTLCFVLALAILYIPLNIMLNRIFSITGIVIADITLYAIFHIVLDKIIIKKGQQAKIF